MSLLQLQENYQIGQLIGHGSSCTVRKVIRKDTRQIYAIKCYDNQNLIAKNQIDMLVRLQHPSIVNIYEIYQQEDTMCLVLQYMAGGQLYPSISQKKKFTQSQVRQYMKAIVDAVRYCHQLKIVHRDIKPQNLLLTTNGPDAILKLADFGISKIISDQTLTTNCGTPCYMAPQIWEGKQYNQKVDVWSMGVVMYYLLTGQHPFDGQDDVKLSQAIRTHQVDFQGQVWNFITPKAQILLKLMLEKNPDNRISALGVANHIWLNYVQSLPSTIHSLEDYQQIYLTHTIDKVGRYIFKDKMKKTDKKIKALANTKIKLKRKQFCFAADQCSMFDQSLTTQVQS